MWDIYNIGIRGSNVYNGSFNKKNKIKNMYLNFNLSLLICTCINHKMKVKK